MLLEEHGDLAEDGRGDGIIEECVEARVGELSSLLGHDGAVRGDEGADQGMRGLFVEP